MTSSVFALMSPRIALETQATLQCRDFANAPVDVADNKDLQKLVDILVTDSGGNHTFQILRSNRNSTGFNFWGSIRNFVFLV